MKLILNIWLVTETQQRIKLTEETRCLPIPFSQKDSPCFKTNKSHFTCKAILNDKPIKQHLIKGGGENTVRMKHFIRIYLPDEVTVLNPEDANNRIY